MARLFLWAQALGATALFAWACSSKSDLVGAPQSASGTGANASSGSSGGAASGGAGGSTTSTTSTTSTGAAGAGGSNGSCMDASQCAKGELCQGGMCVPGCAPDCKGTCCAGDCVADIMSDLKHCGKCDNTCPQPDNIDASCSMGVCALGSCKSGFFDCDGDSANGCESANACTCKPGESQSCYPGPPNTSGKGICKDGTRKCNKAGTAWGLCSGFVIPTKEICDNQIDEDCTGTADDVPDIDGDGWSSCDGDCCETTQDCSSPKKVNPGAFEFLGNKIDDDCDPTTDDVKPPAACSTNQKLGGVTAKDMAQAMELCQYTTQNEPLKTRKWGVIAADFVLPDGTAPAAAQATNIADLQTGILLDFGTAGILPQKGNTMAGMSNGRMRDEDDAGYANPNPGSKFNFPGVPPALYLAQHGGKLPSSLGCSGACPSGSGANDGVNLKLKIRVPTNALSFSYQFRFLSAEYWTYSCSNFNDFYLALLTSAAANIPADHNISFDANKNPLSVNNGFFEVCVKKGCYTCPSGSGELNGTGLELIAPNTSNKTGGATEWLKTTAPVVPGETMTLELMVFDVSDFALDSMALLDQFEWSISASDVGTGPPG